ncbi:PP2C family serine/threonine-protein phosphatase [Plantibacter sp. M259]|uniref:PP2C family protein-serine/threonine phosphatase n=1 Tax=Plantibacter sp. M259 TaxID=2583822 RepID=UPI001110EA2A|nr:protein phosphatase 2C domain-containing protein [Plantibacter sp. M259]
MTTIETARSTHTLRSEGRTDTGLVRRLNEDAFYAGAPAFVVADGMGGHERGEVASREVAAALERGIPIGMPTTTEAVVTTIVTANAVIRSIPTPNGVIGTTVAGLALVALSPQTDLHWMVFNVGDSRVYTWADGALRRITVDHSAVQELVDAGSITEEEAREHPDRNIVTKAIGVEAGIDPDVWLLPVAGRQRFLLCSDGLTGELSDERIAEVLSQGFEGAADRLVELALAAGGRDNVTALVVDVVSTSLMSSGPGYDDAGGLGYLEETMPRG